jgi:polysaccharide pyruvyl transferase WcaK-like protein
LTKRLPVRRILIIGGWFGSRNAGDEAILLGLIRLLENRFPDAQLFAHTIDPDYTRSFGVQPVAAPPGPFVKKAWFLARAYSSMDLCVISGGTPIFDYRLMSRLFHFGVPLIAGVPMVFLGVGLKPVKSWRGRLLFRNIFRRVRFLSVRDPEVIDHMRGMGFDGPVHLGVDSAIVMDPAPESLAVGILASAGVDMSKPILAVCPIMLSDDYRGHYHEPVPAARRQFAYSSLAQIADQQSNLGRQVVFIPMHRVPPDDDRVPIAAIVDRMRSQSFLIEPPEDPQVVSALLGAADMLIGMRLHSIVLATARGVPTIGIGFDMKVGGYMRYLGIGDYCLPIADFTFAELTDAVEKCWANRDTVREELNVRMADWRSLAEDTIEQMAQRIEG